MDRVRKLNVFGEVYALTSEIKAAEEVKSKAAIDTLTEHDKEGITQDILDALNVSVLGRIEKNGNIVLSLPAGTYSLKYEKSDGTTVDICGVTVT